MPTDFRQQAEEEHVLLARIARGDTVALERLYHRYRPRLHRFLLTLGCPLAELDAICNETFYVVWQKADSFDGASRPGSWIFGISRHKLLDLVRKEKRRPEPRDPIDIDRMEAPGSGTDGLELQDQLEAALAALPAEQRAVIELAFRDGLAYHEIATVLDCPENTVKTRIFHARRKLREAFPDITQRRGWRNPA